MWIKIEDWLTPMEYSRHIGKSMTWVTKLMQSGKLPYIRYSGGRLIHKSGKILPEYFKPIKMKIKYTKHFPPGNFRCINLFGTLFYKGNPPVRQKTLNHEGTHTEQMKELLWVGFYILYGLEWVIRLFTDTKRAYRRISFEQEAYANQSNDSYNTTREKFAWTKYLWWNENKSK